MKTLLPIFAFLFLIPFYGHSQVENLSVETYYISDGKDASDTTGGRTLEESSTTYRVFMVLSPSYKLKKIYGDANHTLLISSTENFYNNIDRPAANFGYLINKSWFPSNPILGLDSWLTIGLAAKSQTGVLKSEDLNGSFIGGSHNYGGTAAVEGGLLVNTTSAAGIPLLESDGMMPDTTTYTQWLDNGFKDLNGIDTTVFGPQNQGKLFQSNNIFLQQNAGVSSNLQGNKVLVAQLTTKGDLAFELNVELLDSLGNVVKCVARNPKPDEVLSPYLTYPLPCGCRDARYLEYNPSFGCENRDSCKTLIIFGCMDPAACNYNPEANMTFQELCCYPGRCNDRDISLVCPDLTKKSEISPEFDLFPNPVQDHLAVKLVSHDVVVDSFEIYDMLGRKILGRNVSLKASDYSGFNINVSEFKKGIYMICLKSGESSTKKKFIKN